MAKKLSQAAARELLLKLKYHIDDLDKEKLLENLRCNGISSIEEYIEGLANYAFAFNLIESQTYAASLRDDLRRGTLSQFELEEIFRVNQSTSIPVLLFELDKSIRKSALRNEYKKRIRNVERGNPDNYDQDGIMVTTLAEVFRGFEEIAHKRKALSEELESKLAQIDNEQFAGEN